MIILLLLLYSALASVFNNQTDVEILPPPKLKSKRALSELPKQTNYITKHIDSCPSVGYFFKSQLIQPGNSLQHTQCFLCFCKDNSTAVCWPRENKRCDNEHYHRHGIGKRDIRPRRSPAGFTDIFFRDAARDVFNKQTPEQCKPYESSFSEGCPPDDWCVGCTVCDCDANGRWDCHILSFCAGEDGKVKKPKGRLKKKVYMRKENEPYEPPKKPKKKPVMKPVTTQKPKKTTTIRKGRRGKQSNKSTRKDSDRGTLTKLTPRQRVKTNLATNPASKTQVKRSPQVKTSPTVNKPSKNKKQTKMPNKTTPKPTAVEKPTNKARPIRKRVLRKRTVPSTKAPTTSKAKPKIYLPKNADQSLITAQISKDILGQFRGAVESAIKKQLTPKRAATKTTAKPAVNKTNKKVVRKVEKPTVVLSGDEDDEEESRRRRKRQVLKEDNGELQHGYSRYKRFAINSILGATTHDTINAYSDTPTSLQMVIETSTESPLLTMDSYYQYSVGKENRLGKNYINTTSTYENVKAAENYLYMTESPSLTAAYQYSVENFTQNYTLLEENFNSSNIYNENNTKSDIHQGYFFDKLKDTSYNNTKNNIDNYSTIDIESTIRKIAENTIDRNKTIFNAPENGITISNYTYENQTELKPMRIDEESEYDIKINIKKKNHKSRTAMSRQNTNNVSWSLLDANDLKFNNLSELKALKEYRLNTVNNTKFKINKTNHSHTTNDRNALEVRRIPKPKKFKLKKIINVKHKNKTMKFTKSNAAENTSHLHEFHQFFKKLLGKSNRKVKTTKKKSNNALKYLHKFFKQIFNENKKVSKTHRSKNNAYKKHLQILCDTFGPCHKRTENNTKLKEKIKFLSIETNNMLRSIKIIHGLLKLLNLNDKTSIGVNVTKVPPTFKEDIQILRTLLKSSFLDDNMKNLTITEINQIEYIKSNVLSFIRSAGNFAVILNEIIDVINKSPIKNPVDPSRNTRYVKQGNEIDSKIGKLRDLLHKFNLLQNVFMHRIYKVVSSFDKSMKDRPSANEIHKKTNRSAVIHINTKNIIKNLRKLKNLAQRLESKSRLKRDARDEDSLEYVLMLMEYLMKQNHPLDTAPANDGIDLLLEAIKNAPDIKSIKKKVLHNGVSANLIVTTSSPAEFMNSDNLKDESSSDLQNILKEENYSSKVDDSRLAAIERTLDNDIEKSFRGATTEKVKLKINEELGYSDQDNIERAITEKDEIYLVERSSAEHENETNKEHSEVNEIEKGDTYHDIEKKLLKETKFPIETTTESPLNKGTQQNLYTSINETNVVTINDKFAVDVTQSANFDKNVKTNRNDDGRRYDALNMDHDDGIDTIPSTTLLYLKESTTDDVSSAKTKLIEDLSDSADQQLNWEDVYEDNGDINILTTTKTTTKATSSTKPRKTMAENIIGISKEWRDDKKKWLYAEDVLNKKEMNLLNSLDYRTDLSDSDVTADIKETDEKDSAEALASY